jgi:putative ABC transport system permease protein
MDVFRQDLLFAWRTLRKDAAFAAAVVLTLAICLGANAAIFTLVRSVLLRPLPYAEPDRLISSYDSFPGAGVERAGTSVPNYFDRREMKDVFEDAALFEFSGYRVGQGASAEGVAAMDVTPSFFHVLGARPATGRLFREDDGTVGRNRVVVLSHAFAAKQPGGATGVIGRQLRLNDTVYDVVGVLPDGFSFLNPDVRLYTPLAFRDEDRREDRRFSQNHDLISRLAPGVTLEQAQARVDAMNAQIIERAGAIKGLLVNAGYATRMVGLQADLVRDVRGALILLWGGVLFVVLIAAVNIANLSLVRTSARMKELATRSAIGAGRGRIARQLVTEALLLTLVGGALGLLVGFWSLGALEWIGLSDLPRAHEIGIDRTVFGLTFGLALLLGLAVGLAPSIHLARSSLSGMLREEGRSGTSGRATRHMRRALVVSQVALAFVLLVGAGLLLASFQRLLRVDPGFTASGVITARIVPLSTRHRDETALRTYVNLALERIRALPGVEAAGITSYLPFSTDASSNVIIPEGRAMSPGESVVSPNTVIVTPGYLEALKVTLERGRLFTEADGPDAPRVVILDAQLAQRFWPNADPIGRRVYLPSSPQDVAKPGPNVTWLQVVGIVANVKMKGLVEGEQARVGAYYQPYAQSARRGLGLVVRSRADLTATTAAVQQALASIDPETKPFEVFSMSERVEKSLNPRRVPMLLSSGFGLLALLLASIGLYGVLAYQVTQRTREIGIRLALGADARGILRLVLIEGALLVGLGLAGGLVGALALRGVVAAQLYGIGALDPTVMVTAVVVLGVVSLAACLGPARRAARVSPLVALSQ